MCLTCVSQIDFGPTMLHADLLLSGFASNFQGHPATAFEYIQLGSIIKLQNILKVTCLRSLDNLGSPNSWGKKVALRGSGDDCGDADEGRGPR